MLSTVPSSGDIQEHATQSPQKPNDVALSNRLPLDIQYTMKTVAVALRRKYAKRSNMSQTSETILLCTMGYLLCWGGRGRGLIAGHRHTGGRWFGVLTLSGDRQVLWQFENSAWTLLQSLCLATPLKLHPHQTALSLAKTPQLTGFWGYIDIKVGKINLTT